MKAILDCGTTNTSLYILNPANEIIAMGVREIGVRNTSITGSKLFLKEGVEELYHATLRQKLISENDIKYVVASGMISSEIGLIEIPHLVAPVGLQALSKSMVKIEDKSVLDISPPTYFIRGIKNRYPQSASLKDLRVIDFMRGEETQCMGILDSFSPILPVNIVVFSSHTKIIHINEHGEICHSLTTLSGQIFEAIKNSTNIGKSVSCEDQSEMKGEMKTNIIRAAVESVEDSGFIRTLLMPRFMEVLLDTQPSERRTFIDATIAADDLKVFEEFHLQGYGSKRYILFGHKERCNLYEMLLHWKFGEDMVIDSIHDPEMIAMLTIRGSLTISKEQLKS